MAVSEFDLFKINRYCSGKAPPSTSTRCVSNHRCGVIQSPSWSVEHLGPSHSPSGRHNVAQIRFDADTGNWSLYWRDRNSKWHPFDLVEPGTVDQMLVAIDEDAIAIFWG